MFVIIWNKFPIVKLLQFVDRSIDFSILLLFYFHILLTRLFSILYRTFAMNVHGYFYNSLYKIKQVTWPTFCEKLKYLILFELLFGIILVTNSVKGMSLWLIKFQIGIIYFKYLCKYSFTWSSPPSRNVQNIAVFFGAHARGILDIVPVAAIDWYSFRALHFRHWCD